MSPNHSNSGSTYFTAPEAVARETLSQGQERDLGRIDKKEILIEARNSDVEGNLAQRHS